MEKMQISIMEELNCASKNKAVSLLIFLYFRMNSEMEQLKKNKHDPTHLMLYVTFLNVIGIF